MNGAVIKNNWVHGNRSVGLWADTNNRGFDIEDNYIGDNFNSGLIYEISYNALIKGNAFVRNGLGAGALNSGFPTSAIYISESGSDRRVPGKYGNAFLITENNFINNWGGIVLWENSNRFCNSPANTEFPGIVPWLPRLRRQSSHVIHAMSPDLLMRTAGGKRRM